MRLYQPPAGLEIITHFKLPKVQTWGSLVDRQYKEQVRAAANLLPYAGKGYAWFAFDIVCRVAFRRGRIANQVPDVENIPKLIVDAFTGLLYPDDNLHYVRGVQVEAELSTDETEYAEVWIYGCPKD